MAVGDPCQACGCAGTQFCNFEVIAKSWTFTIPQGIIANNTCAFCAGYAGTWTLVYSPTAIIGGGFVSQPAAVVPCYAPVVDHAWAMLCLLDEANQLTFSLQPFFMNSQSRYCIFPHLDSLTEYRKSAALFNPVQPNTLNLFLPPDVSNCRPCDFNNLAAITITPVF